MKWYLLPNNELRRDIGHILNQVQNGVVITIGPFDDLNLELASVVSIVRNQSVVRYFVV